MPELRIIPRSEFDRIWKADINSYDKLAPISDMCRLNTLVAVKKAGSGHLGSSFSAMDIVVWLYYCEMNTLKMGFDNVDRDIYFSSKGHDVPGLYSVLHSLGVFSDEKLLKLRRLGGLHGHPDVSDLGIEANSGSLGLGISKARGMAWSKDFFNRSGRIFVMTGDGELQEGQIYEALQGAAHLNKGYFTVVVDYNKVQTDKLVDEIISLKNLERKFSAFGWYVERCDGHDFHELQRAFSACDKITEQPRVIIADTIKGKGISFMEHPEALEKCDGIYPWHAGAPDDDSFAEGFDELIVRINETLNELSLQALALSDVTSCSINNSRSSSVHFGEQLSQTNIEKQKKVSIEYIANAYGEELVNLASEVNNFVVLDGDLSADCRLRDFENKYPERFIEVGIAEQDMVSMAGGMARQGLIPIVNTFASFLSARSNEQIYNNASENSKIVYVCHYAGLIPAGPGKSHQSLRDISLFGALANMTIIQPSNAVETKQALRYCINEAKQNCMLRLVIGPSPQIINLPDDYNFQKGQGFLLSEGQDAALFAYGPVMLNEALIAADMLKEKNFNLKVINMSWLNVVDTDWLESIISDIEMVFVLEDHSTVGGLGNTLLNVMVSHNILNDKLFKIFGVENYPVCGTPQEALDFHGLSAKIISEKIYSQK
ncbi:MAG: 1-deoxy-D-xylulose-5-phosphate synthase [Candidatus Marinimicrobia bacterium]|nr:1-deoxy-D-xylulose-5-phosphate synthase [Candidatus Neomarinimicrobiota bacterium]|tara:strand:+ start:5218 stop:7194 length:1977 start_codon:yes stop_codon:yes gene_type:complete